MMVVANKAMPQMRRIRTLTVVFISSESVEELREAEWDWGFRGMVKD